MTESITGLIRLLADAALDRQVGEAERKTFNGATRTYGPVGLEPIPFRYDHWARLLIRRRPVRDLYDDASFMDDQQVAHEDRRNMAFNEVLKLCG